MVQQPIDGIDDMDALIVAGGVAVEGDNGFGVIVGDRFQQGHFPVEGGFLKHGRGHLEIINAIILPGHKVDFRCTDLADVHLVTPARQFQIHNIFKREAQIIPFPGEQMAADAKIYDIQLLVRFQQLSARNIIPFYRIKDIRFNQSVHIVADGTLRNASAAGGNIIRNTLHGNGIAYRTGQEFGDVLQKRKIIYFALVRVFLLPLLPSISLTMMVL